MIDTIDDNEVIDNEEEDTHNRNKLILTAAAVGICHLWVCFVIWINRTPWYKQCFIQYRKYKNQYIYRKYWQCNKNLRVGLRSITYTVGWYNIKKEYHSMEQSDSTRPD